ncbi:MAG: hypothetical protein IKU84_04030 [Clostridia bacterium]|nr:hypothetical protein [Clostridia bacterium]
MKFFYQKICRPLMLVNYNIYTFISGIILSLSTGVFTFLALERTGKADILHDWHLYMSAVFYLVAGALCMYIATKLTPVHDHIRTYNKLKDSRFDVLDGLYGEFDRGWVITFVILIASLLAGTVFLVLNYFIA